MRRKGAAAGVTATVGAAILWGSSFSVNDIGLQHVGPGTFAFLRFAIAGAICLGVLAILGKAKWPTLGGRPPLWFWGLCAANALAFLLQYLAQTMTTPARTALFVNTSAFMVALLERALFGLRLGGKRWIAIVVGFTGAAILIVGADPAALAGGRVDDAAHGVVESAWLASHARIDDAAHGVVESAWLASHARILGDALAMIAGAVWSVYFVYNDRAVERHDPVMLVAWTFAGTAAFLAFAPLLDPWLSKAPTSGMDATGALAIAYSGLFTTALAFGLWTFGLTRIRASVSAVLLMVEILVASVVSYFLGRETFGPTDLLGAALLVGALAIAGTIARTDAASASSQ